ncbi:MAG: prolyl oligopeptidase family serine peptidase [Candidatus Beckwithbacteria bacterium]|nr:prolyl oligopeptidase family serine peptidase [Candidatus Beckwithbacteria bacterium]
MRKIIVIMAGALVLSVAAWYFWPKEKKVFLSPEAPYLVVVKPLEKYSFPELRQRLFTPDGIWVEADKFYYWVSGKKVSGQIHLPAQAGVPVGSGPFPVVIMIRGYVDREEYQPGVGTRRAAEVLAQNGFITLAPDFLGFAESDMPPVNVLEDRFWRPIEVLQLIASVKNLPQADTDKISIWGHSNGGQIALSVLEISGQDYPTTLWAPVSKPFPYSILYYTDEHDDFGKALRKVVAGFEAQYDSDEFSIHEYYHWINAPVQIHQGTADDSVPVKWSQDLAKALEDKDKEVELNVYPGADHNLKSPSTALGIITWDTAVQKDILWFNTH